MALIDARRCTDCGTCYDVWMPTATEPFEQCFEHPEEKPLCPRCSSDVYTKPPKRVALLGQPRGKDLYIKQLGKTFSSTRELDRYLEANNMHVASKSEARAVKDEARNEADDYIKEKGYSDSEAYKKHIADADSLAESVAAVRQQKIDDYHDKHGTEGKGTVQDDVWVDKLPGT